MRGIKRMLDRKGSSCASRLATALIEHGFSPFVGTPCGVLAPLYAQLQAGADLITVSREDNAVGVAAGSALMGKCPVVLMQNSGLGQSVNAIASLVTPYGIPLLFIIGMRGVAPDATSENEVMGRLTEPIFQQSAIPAVWLDEAGLADHAEWSRQLVVKKRTAAALLVRPTLFGWQP
ncbi:thiamine pyrophosphate-binding protein [Solwaraspora sp. WMMB335]|uniref:thiamine pyrophosphate-binding protein n=1 Tax=Solwaraspora sp. WMMB335 TaxID=3404118 RepID=UPI003B9611DF